MNKKEFTNLVKNLALHFGERVSCEWMAPGNDEWLQWDNAEITVQFLMDLEKGYIRNIQMPNETLVTVRAELITAFDTFQEWVNKASSRLGTYHHEKIICIDQSNKILLSGKEFSFARDNNLFPVNAYQMKKNTDL